jgi:chorismate mutase
MKDLADARRILDQVDRQLVELLARRLQTVAEIAQIKWNRGSSPGGGGDRTEGRMT